MEELELKVKGMVCEGCEKRVVNSLSTIDGISDVIASHEKGLVTLKVAENINVDEIKERIEELGFECC